MNDGGVTDNPAPPCPRLLPRSRPSRGAEPGSGLGLHLEHLPATIHAGLHVDMMGPAQLTGILVFYIGRLLQRVGGTPHAASRRRCLLLRHGHGGLLAFLDTAANAKIGAVNGSRAYNGCAAGLLVHFSPSFSLPDFGE